MKTFEEIVAQEPVFMNDWNSRKGVIMDFEGYLSDEAKSRYKDVNILFASYSYENYSGDAWVMFEQDGKLYEVNGSHCSCYGLEDQWSPEEILLEELEHRLTKGTFGEDSYSGNNFKNKLCDFLGVEYKTNSRYYF